MTGPHWAQCIRVLALVCAIAGGLMPWLVYQSSPVWHVTPDAWSRSERTPIDAATGLALSIESVREGDTIMLWSLGIGHAVGALLLLALSFIVVRSRWAWLGVVIAYLVVSFVPAYWGLPPILHEVAAALALLSVVALRPPLTRLLGRVAAAVALAALVMAVMAYVVFAQDVSVAPLSTTLPYRVAGALIQQGLSALAALLVAMLIATIATAVQLRSETLRRRRDV